MKKYLIDINIISYLADTESIFHETVRARFRSLAKEDEVFLSILSLYEFHYSLSRAREDIDPKRFSGPGRRSSPPSRLSR